MATTNQQPQPGSLFRVPSASARSIYLPEGTGASITGSLEQGTSTSVPFNKYDQTTITRAHDLLITLTNTGYTPGTSTLTTSDLFPFNIIQNVQVNFESTFSTINQSGFTAATMQGYRPARGRKTGFLDQSNLFVNTGNVASINTKQQAAGVIATASPTDATATINLGIELAESIEFDLYWELNSAGQPVSAPAADFILVPQVMSGTTKIITPVLTFAPMLSTNNAKASPVSATTGTGAFNGGSYSLKLYKSGWYPSNNPAVEPFFASAWRYTRGEFVVPISGSTAVIDFASQLAGQGQLLSFIAWTWDPTLNSGAGGLVPVDSAHIASIFLYVGAGIVYRQYNDISALQLEWLRKHGTFPPYGVIPIDLAIDEHGRFTNGADVLNTLTTAGCQLVINWASGYTPAYGTQVVVGTELLKQVGAA